MLNSHVAGHIVATHQRTSFVVAFEAYHYWPWHVKSLVVEEGPYLTVLVAAEALLDMAVQG